MLDLGEIVSGFTIFTGFKKRGGDVSFGIDGETYTLHTYESEDKHGIDATHRLRVQVICRTSDNAWRVMYENKCKIGADGAEDLCSPNITMDSDEQGPFVMFRHGRVGDGLIRAHSYCRPNLKKIICALDGVCVRDYFDGNDRLFVSQYVWDQGGVEPEDYDEEEDDPERTDTDEDDDRDAEPIHDVNPVHDAEPARLATDVVRSTSSTSSSRLTVPKSYTGVIGDGESTKSGSKRRRNASLPTAGEQRVIAAAFEVMHAFGMPVPDASDINVIVSATQAVRSSNTKTTATTLKHTVRERRRVENVVWQRRKRLRME